LALDRNRIIISARTGYPAMTLSPSAPSRRRVVLALAFGLTTMAWSGAGEALAQYQAAPWCAATGGFGSAWDCSYYTFEQCMATARGLSNYCAQNPRYIAKQSRKARGSK
jgi:hypothetical protein